MRNVVSPHIGDKMEYIEYDTVAEFYDTYVAVPTITIFFRPRYSGNERA